MPDLLDALEEDAIRLGRILRSLEEKGYLTRVLEPGNRRVLTASLTVKGRELVNAMEDQFIRIHEEILQDSPMEIRQSVLTALENLLLAIEQWLSDA